MNFIKKHFLPHKNNGFRPTIHRLPALLLIGLFVLSLNITNNFALTNKVSVLGYATNVSIGELLSRTNSQRTASGLAPLSLNSQLNSAAQSKAMHMITNNYWSHTGPDGSTPWTFIGASGYNYQTAGENLAFGFSTSAGVITGWMNSPTHRANILNSLFTEVGFGVLDGENFQGGPNTVIVAMYGAPFSAPPAPPSNPTPSPPAEAPIAQTPETENNQPTQPTQQEEVEPIESNDSTQNAPQTNSNEPAETTDEAENDLTEPEEEAADSGAKIVVTQTDDNDKEVIAETLNDNPSSTKLYQELLSFNGSWVLRATTIIFAFMALTFAYRHIRVAHNLLSKAGHIVHGKPILEIALIYGVLLFMLFTVRGQII